MELNFIGGTIVDDGVEVHRCVVPGLLEKVYTQAYILELKTVTEIAPVHKAQLLSYLKRSSKPLRLLLNLHEPLIKKKIFRLLNCSLCLLCVSVPLCFNRIAKFTLSSLSLPKKEKPKECQLS